MGDYCKETMSKAVQTLRGGVRAAPQARLQLPLDKIENMKLRSIRILRALPNVQRLMGPALSLGEVSTHLRPSR
jgi:hypothetical protein